MKKLEGRVAVVTGGTRGIGRAIAEAFLEEGANVVVSGRSADKGRQALAEIDAGKRAHFIAGDVMSQSDVESLIDESAEHFGSLDILVNNAGGSDGFAPVHELSDEAWNRALAWNLNSTFWGTRRRAALHACLGVGPDHLHLLGRGQAGDQAHGEPLRHKQARHPRPGEGGRLRVWPAGHHLQRHLPRRGRDRPHARRRCQGGRGDGHHL